MLRLLSLRWPYREDVSFSALALIVFLVPLAFTVNTYENFETIKFLLFVALLGIGLFAYVLNREKVDAAGAGEEHIRTPLCLPFLVILGCFVFFAFLAFVFSPNKFLSFFGYYPRYTNGLFFYLAFALFLFLLAATLNRQKYFFLLKIFVFDSLLVSIYGLFQSAGLGLYSGLETDALVRAPSFIGNPNFSSLFILPALPVALVFMIQSLNLSRKLYYGLTIVVILWALSVFSSRGAVLGGAALLGAFAAASFWQKALRKQLLWLGLILCIGFGFLYIFGPLARPSGLKDTFKITDSNITNRYYVWDLTRRAIAEHPWAGVGFGNFYEYYQSHREPLTADQPSFDDSHNLFLFLAVTGGLPFAAAFIAILFFSFWALVFKAKSGFGLWPAALAAGLSGWAIAASFTPVTIPCFLILGLLCLGQTFFTQPTPIKIKIPSLMGAVIKILAISMVVYSVWFMTAEFLFFQGLQAFFRKDYERSIKFTAWAKSFYPLNPIYSLYRLGSEIKSRGDTPEVIKGLQVFYNPNSVLFKLRSANLDFLLFLKTQKQVYAKSAIAKVKEVLDLNPNRAELHVRLAFYAYDSGNQEQAIVSVKKALTLNARYFPAWLLYAKLYQEAGEAQKMLYGLQKVYKLYPNNVYLKNLLAQARKADDIKNLPFQAVANYDVLE